MSSSTQPDRGRVGSLPRIDGSISIRYEIGICERDRIRRSPNLGELRRRFSAMVFAACAFAVTGCGENPGGMAPMGPAIDRPAFDGGRAYDHVVTQVGFGPRIPGSLGHEAQLEWMVQMLDTLADGVVVDSFTHTAEDGVTLPLRNVLATFEPSEPRSDGRKLMVLAHWDTRPKSDAAPPPLDTVPVPGANDGASGVAVLLELARLLGEQRAPVGVELLFVDGEDYGRPPQDMFVGARHYAENVPVEAHPAYAILLDMVGDARPRFPIEGVSAMRAGDVARRVWGVAAELGYGPWFPVEVGPAIGDDHVPLNDAGIPAIDIIDFTYGEENSYWHTPEDTPDKVSADALDMVGEVVAEVLYRGG